MLSEVYLRVFRFQTLKHQSRDLAYIPDTLYGYRYVPNSEQVFSRPGMDKRFRFNNHGWYGPDFSTKKKTGVYRIIFVGNSSTLGMRSDGDENFAMKLQKLFASTHKNVEVINCSVDGKNRDVFNMNIIKHTVTKYSPDLVMYEYNFPLREDSVMRDVYKDYVLKYDYAQRNDTAAIKELKSKIDRIYSATILRKMYDLSFNVRLLCRWINNNRGTAVVKFINKNVFKTEYITAYINKEKGIFIKGKKKDSFSEQVSVKMYRDLETYLNNLNIKLATYTFYGGESYSELYKPTFSLELRFNDTYTVKDEGHLNDKGYDLIAKEMFQQLVHSPYLKSTVNSRPIKSPKLVSVIH